MSTAKASTACWAALLPISIELLDAQRGRVPGDWTMVDQKIPPHPPKGCVEIQLDGPAGAEVGGELVAPREAADLGGKKRVKPPECVLDLQSPDATRRRARGQV